MYKILAVFAVLALAGAGCTWTPNVNTETDSQLQTEPIIADDGNEASLEDDMIDGVEVEVEGEGDVQVNPIDLNTGADAEVNATLNMNMDSGNFFFTPDSITAKAGQTVNVNIVSNAGFHTFVIDAIDLKQTVNAGETITFTAPATPGSYTFYCDVGSHQAMGMEGTLIVE